MVSVGFLGIERFICFRKWVDKWVGRFRGCSLVLDIFVFLCGSFRFKEGCKYWSVFIFRRCRSFVSRFDIRRYLGFIYLASIIIGINVVVEFLVAFVINVFNVWFLIIGDWSGEYVLFIVWARVCVCTGYSFFFVGGYVYFCEKAFVSIFICLYNYMGLYLVYKGMYICRDLLRVVYGF